MEKEPDRKNVSISEEMIATAIIWDVDANASILINTNNPMIFLLNPMSSLKRPQGVPLYRSLIFWFAKISVIILMLITASTMIAIMERILPTIQNSTSHRVVDVEQDTLFSITLKTTPKVPKLQKKMLTAFILLQLGSAGVIELNRTNLSQVARTLNVNVTRIKEA